MISRTELLKLRQETESSHSVQQRDCDLRALQKFEERLQQVAEKLDMRLRTAAKLHYLELRLIKVDRRYIDMSKLWKNSRFFSYPDKSAVRHPGLVALWERIEAYGLRPFFIEGDEDGEPRLYVQLPDGGQYPRNDSSMNVSERTRSRMDEFLEENGGFEFTHQST